jgi:hypothetical protein
MKEFSAAAIHPMLRLKPIPLWVIGVGLFFLALLLRLACFTGLIAFN